MSGRIILGLFAGLTLVFIMIMIFKSGDDNSEAKPVNICRNEEEHNKRDYFVGNNLNELRLDDNFTDITIVSNNFELRAHKLILAAHSKYFDSMFWSKGQTEQNNSFDRLDIPNHVADQKSVSYALYFMYSTALPSEIFENEVEYSNLLKAATEFQMDSLKCEISKRLNIHINANNVAHIVALAEVYNAKFLLTMASNYLLEHFDEVRKTNEWKVVAENNSNILANAIDFHGKLPLNSLCDIQCEMITSTTPSIFMTLRRFFITQRYADAVVHVINEDDKMFNVNRAILIAQSPLFRQKFATSPKSIEVKNVESAVMEEFLVYMYSGWPSQLKKFAESLLYLSEEYQMSPLKNACEDIIIDELNIQNAGKIAQIAYQANSSRISSVVLDFILKNRKEIVTTKSWAELKNRNPQLLTKLFL